MHPLVCLRRRTSLQHRQQCLGSVQAVSQVSNTYRGLAHRCREQLDGAQLLCPFSRNIFVNVAVTTLMVAIMPYHAIA